MNSIKLYPFVLRALNIRQEEKMYVQHLFLHYLFQGFAMALLFTVANAYFLAHYPITTLPVVYMLAAVAMLAIGRLYAYLEHRLPLPRLMTFIVIALALSMILLFLGVRIFHYTYTWIGIALMVGYRTLYLLSSLEFWGISASLFDVRQGKRLFGLISVGDVPAKLLGYLAVALLLWVVPEVGLENLLLIAAVAFLSCLFFIRKILRRNDFSSEKHQVEEPSHGASGSGDLISKIFKSEFILVLAGLSLVFVASITLVEYSFWSTVQATYSTEAELARFTSLFFGFINGVTFVSRLFLSGRIIDQWGVRAALLVLPGLLLTAVVAFLRRGWWPGSKPPCWPCLPS